MKFLFVVMLWLSFKVGAPNDVVFMFAAAFLNWGIK